MREFGQFLILLFGIPLAAMFFRLVWRLMVMSEMERRELCESYEKRQRTKRMIRFWLSGGKSK